PATSTSAHADATEEASIVTRVKQSPAPPSSGFFKGRVAAVAVGLVGVAAIFGVYSYMRQTPAPVVTSTQTTATPTPEPTAQPTPAVASQSPAPSPTPSQPAPRTARQPGRSTTGGEAEARRGEAGQTPRPPAPPDAGDSDLGLTPEEEAEIQRGAARARQDAERVRREALRSVRQMLEEQRRQRIQEERRRREEQRRPPPPVPPAS
ncbi:MAG TPA: hypothetical protein VF754_03600, partial [Pyrinomonadaceae bacterium]